LTKYSGLTKQQGHSGRNKTAVLLVNLGTPEAPTTQAVRRYLREFLSDPRVIEIPWLLWKIILHGIILRIRPAKSAALYKKVWRDTGSPLLHISLQQTNKLDKLLQAQGYNVNVNLAMRYGNQSIASVMQKIHRQGVDKVIVLPLYPQYAAPTTGSVFDALATELMRWRYLPSVHFIHTYHQHPVFIETLAASIQDYFEAYGKPQRLILSYHGMPQRNLHLGDPYYCFCMQTTQSVVAKLGLKEDEYMSTFQSRFGKAAWLQPYTDVTMAALPDQGVKHVALVCPAFSADCLETLEEIEGENREIFMNAGGISFHYIPALNDNDQHIKMMADLVKPYF
jgi:ferrochelatase